MTIAVIPIPGLPMIEPGMPLDTFLGDAIDGARVGVKAQDVVVVCQKVISKGRGRARRLSGRRSRHRWPGSSRRRRRARIRARSRSCCADEADRAERPRTSHRRDRARLGVRERGMDESNGVEDGVVTLLPVDADASPLASRRASWRASASIWRSS
jgi:F420-0:gamma-glutamyl ligase